MQPRTHGRHILLACLLLVATVLVLWRLSVTRQSSLRDIAEYVLAKGKSGRVVKEGLEYFGLPADDVRFRQVLMVSESGRMKSFQVRRRRDHLDIFLVDVSAGETAAYFFLASPEGELLQAAHLNPAPGPVRDADKRFHHELKFWSL
jgi:hypothetical protein